MPKNDEAPHLEVTMRSRPLSVSVSVLSDNTEQLWKSMWGIINNKNTWKGVTMRSRPLSVWKGAAKTPASAAPSIGLYTWMCSWCFCQCWLYSSCAALLLWNPQPFYVKFASQQQQTCVHLEIGGGEILGITSFARLPNQTRVTLDDMKMGFLWFYHSHMAEVLVNLIFVVILNTFLIIYHCSGWETCYTWYKLRHHCIHLCHLSADTLAFFPVVVGIIISTITLTFISQRREGF